MRHRLDKDGNRYGKIINYRCSQTQYQAAARAVTLHGLKWQRASAARNSLLQHSRPSSSCVTPPAAAILAGHVLWPAVNLPSAPVAIVCSQDSPLAGRFPCTLSLATAAAGAHSAKAMCSTSAVEPHNAVCAAVMQGERAASSKFAGRPLPSDGRVHTRRSRRCSWQQQQQ